MLLSRKWHSTLCELRFAIPMLEFVHTELRFVANSLLSRSGKKGMRAVKSARKMVREVSDLLVLGLCVCCRTATPV